MQGGGMKHATDIDESVNKAKPNKEKRKEKKERRKGDDEGKKGRFAPY
jgi:hypothetical protein